MKKLYIIVLIHVICSLAGTTIHAQDVSPDTSKIWRIQTVDGNEYIGKIIARDTEQLVLQMDDIGTLTLSVRSIQLMREVDPKRLIRGKYWSENPQSARYFFAPNGYGLRKGEGYYQNVWVLFNQASVGITDHFTIGVGMLPLFLFNVGTTPVWITPKVSFPVKKEKFQIGAGALTGISLGENVESSFFGIGYGVATLGNRDKNLTVGLGYGFTGDEFSRSPLVTISGMVRTGQRGYLMLESYFSRDFSLALLGGRTVWSKVSLDYGGGIPLNGIEGIIIPWLGIAVPFGK